MRADVFLVEHGHATTRSQAQRLIASGVQWRLTEPSAWRKLVKNGEDIPAGAQVELLDASEARYVSRGGLKLEGALAAVGLDVSGLHCLDVGQSTGGFTDCLLQLGARAVVGVDVGQGQLHPQLREDPRVLCVEQVNARALNATDLIAASACPASAVAEFDQNFCLIVADLSFISLTLVLPALVPLLADTGAMLLLVKPQFELQPGQVGKGGIVRDPALYAVVEERIRASCQELGLAVEQWLDSPIQGGDGNREFFVYARRAA